MAEVAPGLTDEAGVRLVRPERMLHPGLTNLLKAIVVARSAAHPVEIVHNNRMIGRGQGKEIHDHVSGIARSGAHAQAHLSPVASKLLQASYFPDISRDDIGSWVKTFRSIPSSAARGSRISRAVAQKQKQRECEITQYLPKHCLNPPIQNPNRRL
jgi:hypothetical protein